MGDMICWLHYVYAISYCDPMPDDLIAAIFLLRLFVMDPNEIY